MQGDPTQLMQPAELLKVYGLHMQVLTRNDGLPVAIAAWKKTGVKSFFSYYRPFMGLFWLDCGCAIRTGLLELVFLLAITIFIDTLPPQGDWTLTIAAAIGLLVLYIINARSLSVVIYSGHKLGINIETNMRAEAFDHLTRLS